MEILSKLIAEAGSVQVLRASGEFSNELSEFCSKSVRSSRESPCTRSLQSVQG